MDTLTVLPHKALLIDKSLSRQDTEGKGRKLRKDHNLTVEFTEENLIAVSIMITGKWFDMPLWLLYTDLLKFTPPSFQNREI